MNKNRGRQIPRDSSPGSMIKKPIIVSSLYHMKNKPVSSLINSYPKVKIIMCNTKLNRMSPQGITLISSITMSVRHKSLITSAQERRLPQKPLSRFQWLFLRGSNVGCYRTYSFGCGQRHHVFMHHINHFCLSAKTFFCLHSIPLKYFIKTVVYYIWIIPYVFGTPYSFSHNYWTHVCMASSPYDAIIP